MEIFLISIVIIIIVAIIVFILCGIYLLKEGISDNNKLEIIGSIIVFILLIAFILLIYGLYKMPIITGTSTTVQTPIYVPIIIH